MSLHSLFRHLKWNSRRQRKDRPHRRQLRSRWALRLEALEDRTVPSTLTVTSPADNGAAGTLRIVLASAMNGDTIQFAHQLDGQTIVLTQGQLAVNQSVAINGPGAQALTISGNAASRIFDVGGGTTVSISGLTMTSGRATDGAGILNAGQLTLANDILRSNVAQGVAGSGLFGDGAGRGGAVESQAGATLAISHGSFTGNEAIGSPNGGNAFGGGIYDEAGTVTINQSTFTGNEAIAANGGSVGIAATMPGGISVTLLGVGGGGGVWDDGGAVSVTNSSLSGNLAQGGSSGDATGSPATFPIVGTAIGGALGSGSFFTTSTPTLAVAASTLSGNQTVGGNDVSVSSFNANDHGAARGGAIGAVAGNISVSNSAVSGNQAQGASLFFVVQGGSTIYALGSPAFGGGIDDDFNFDFSLTFPPTVTATLSISGSTLTGNIARSTGPGGVNVFGGGLVAELVNAQIINSTISGNQALGGPGGGFFVYNGRMEPANGGAVFGGGIDSSGGSLTISGSAVKNNLAQGGSGGGASGSGFGGASFGGGVESGSQTFVLSNSTLSGNQALGGAATAGSGFFAATGGGNAEGGGLYMSGDSPIFGGGASTISGTSFVNNLAEGGVGGGFFGGFCFGGGAWAGSTQLQIAACTFSGNQAISGSGGTGSNGVGGPAGFAEAGALDFFGQPTATISNTTFVANSVRGGDGGAAAAVGAAGGAGGTADSGAIAEDAFGFSGPILIALSNCSFTQNVSQAGAGGAGGSGGIGGSGGNSSGGAMATYSYSPSGPSTTFNNCTFARNMALGGAGGRGGAGAKGGAGGTAQGGGLANDALTGSGLATTLSNCVFALNIAQGGAGGAGGSGAAGGSGGNGQGGGLADNSFSFGQALDTTISNCVFAGNVAQGGAGATGGNGGNGQGGGLFIASGTVTEVLDSVITGNLADGGAAGAGGTAGQGVGGGVYNLGTFELDALSIVLGNLASTSNDNVFGPITPV